MFNLFGSLFFGKAVEQQQPQQQETIATTPMATNEASTQTSNKATTHTQTMESDESSSSPLTATPQQQQQYASFIGPLNYNELHYQYQQMPHTNDWVIVDRSEEADKCTSRIQHQHNTNPTANVLSAEAGINTSTIMQQDNNEQTTTVSHQHEVDSMQETVTVVTNTTNDIILGSFFEKNEQESEEDARRYSTHMRVESSDDEDEQEEADGKVAEEAVTVAPAVVPQKSGNDWQITPLPCLTSTTWSQRSLVAEDPLENLLIEHPSMSVFVTATSSASSSSNSPNKESTYSVNANKRKHVAIVKKQQHKPQVILNEDDTDMLSMLFKCDETNSQATLKTEVLSKAVVLRKPLAVVKVATNTTVAVVAKPPVATAAPVVVVSEPLVKKPAEKRKELATATVTETTTASSTCNRHMISLVNNFHSGCVSPPPMLRHKKGKKSSNSSKSSKSCTSASASSSAGSSSPVNGILAQSPIGPHTKPVSFNKENQQVKTLLLNEYKRAGSGCMGAHTRSIDPASLLNKNQMKRANKNSTQMSTRNLNNQKQRKYHKLQQPTAFYSSSAASNMQF